MINYSFFKNFQKIQFNLFHSTLNQKALLYPFSRTLKKVIKRKVISCYRTRLKTFSSYLLKIQFNSWIFRHLFWGNHDNSAMIFLIEFCLSSTKLSSVHNGAGWTLIFYWMIFLDQYVKDWYYWDIAYSRKLSFSAWDCFYTKYIYFCLNPDIKPKQT